MNLSLTKEQETIQKSIQEFSKKELVETAADSDMAGEFPTAMIRKISELDVFGLLTPPAYGGSGLGPNEFALAIETISAADASFGMSLMASMHAAWLITAFGDEQKKEKYLPALASGEKMAAMACSEPSGGTNWPMTMQTRAESDGDNYVLNGSKCFISNAELADIYVVFVRTDPARGPGGISALIVEKDTPGFTFGKMENKFGLRALKNGELFFDNCRVPKTNLLHIENEGMNVFTTGGGLACIGSASIFTGISQAALDESIEHVKARDFVPTQKLCSLGNVQSKITEMVAEVEAARLLNLKASGQLNHPGPAPFLALHFSCRVALKATADAVEIFGGYGCLQETTVNRLYRDAKTLSLQITNENIRQTCGKLILNVPLH